MHFKKIQLSRRCLSLHYSFLLRFNSTSHHHQKKLYFFSTPHRTCKPTSTTASTCWCCKYKKKLSTKYQNYFRCDVVAATALVFSVFLSLHLFLHRDEKIFSFVWCIWRGTASRNPSINCTWWILITILFFTNTFLLHGIFVRSVVLCRLLVL